MHDKYTPHPGCVLARGSGGNSKHVGVTKEVHELASKCNEIPGIVCMQSCTDDLRLVLHLSEMCTLAGVGGCFPICMEVTAVT
jgi:hypothetical protein